MDTNATHPGNPVNEPNANVPKQSSRIPLEQTRLQTHRFGEYSVHMIMDTIKKDVLPYRHEFDLRTFSLKAPLMQNIAMRNDYFNVPMEAILPFNWEIIMANPTFGDDVPDYCNTTDIDAIRHIRSMMQNEIANIENLMAGGEDNSKICTELVRWALLIEMFYSHGSLLAECGCKLAQFVQITRMNTGGEYDLESPDKFVEFLLENIMTKIPNTMSFSSRLVVMMLMFRGSMPRRSRPLRNARLNSGLRAVQPTGECWMRTQSRRLPA